MCVYLSLETKDRLLLHNFFLSFYKICSVCFTLHENTPKCILGHFPTIDHSRELLNLGPNCRFYSPILTQIKR